MLASYISPVQLTSACLRRLDEEFYIPFPPKLVGRHRCFNVGQPPKTRLLTPLPLTAGRAAPLCPSPLILTMTKADVSEINLRVMFRKSWMWVETLHSTFFSLTVCSKCLFSNHLYVRVEVTIL